MSKLLQDGSGDGNTDDDARAMTICCSFLQKTAELKILKQNACNTKYKWMTSY